MQITGPRVTPRAHPTDLPLACSPYLSYRLRSPYGWVMIAAKNDADALRDARRSTDSARLVDLQRWNGIEYMHCMEQPSPLPFATPAH